MEFQIPLYQFFLNVAMGVFISFIFYFIVIHIETESKKSSVYLYLNNSIGDLDSKIRLLLYKIDPNRHSNSRSASLNHEDVTQIFQTSYQINSLEVENEVLKTAYYLDKNIVED